MFHKIQIKFDYGEIDLYHSWIMALFLLENRDFLGFRMIFKIWLNQIFSNFKAMLWTIRYRLSSITVYFFQTLVEQGYKNCRNMRIKEWKLVKSTLEKQDITEGSHKFRKINHIMPIELISKSGTAHGWWEENIGAWLAVDNWRCGNSNIVYSYLTCSILSHSPSFT
jgi:hypothetical protein